MKKILLLAQCVGFLILNNTAFAFSPTKPDLFVAQIDPVQLVMRNNKDGSIYFEDVAMSNSFSPNLIIENDHITTGKGTIAEIMKPNTNIFVMRPDTGLEGYGTVKLKYIDSSDINNFCDVIINNPSSLHSYSYGSKPSIRFTCTGNLRYYKQDWHMQNSYDYIYVLHFRHDALYAEKNTGSGIVGNIAAVLNAEDFAQFTK